MTYTRTSVAKSDFEVLLSKSIDRRIVKITYNSGLSIEGWIQNYNPNTWPSTMVLVLYEGEEALVDLASIAAVEVMPSPIQI